MFDITANLYHPIYQWTMFALTIIVGLKYLSSGDNTNLLRDNTSVPTYFFVLTIILFIGLRPVSYVFGDTGNYAVDYGRIDTGTPYKIDFGEEWLFQGVEWCFAKLDMDVKYFFFLIEIGYMGFVFWAMQKMLWENTWIGMLFWFGAFSTFTYAVNGLRNGLACSFIVLAMAFAAKDKNYFWTAILAFLAMGIHRSVMLPIAALVASLTVFKKHPEWALYFWVASIGISLVAGGAITNFMMGLGFDDRATSYIGGGVEGEDFFEENNFSSTGFRWDFLLYSSMPVLLIWYTQKRIKESGGYREDGSTILADAESMRVWTVLSVTYLLCNSFWIMVIRAAFSNRFAYLSWFLYPIVLAYGFVRLHIWDDQDRKCAWALIAHACFTAVMFLLGKM